MKRYPTVEEMNSLRLKIEPELCSELLLWKNNSMVKRGNTYIFKLLKDNIFDEAEIEKWNHEKLFSKYHQLIVDDVKTQGRYAFKDMTGSLVQLYTPHWASGFIQEFYQSELIWLQTNSNYVAIDYKQDLTNYFINEYVNSVSEFAREKLKELKNSNDNTLSTETRANEILDENNNDQEELEVE
ncbi:hypothetical protein [Williamsoniiplasma lucivorax]|uniref:Uncharacterized protein n=1 Tax=Williamsoniiplasma lucivorax TaxID=209274 RepID=A0A2S5RDM9_9MOLU|nr:hypothetical protein [Williamsoniiplasma lucivorax]PPE05407.1 hypothetical protein ELUCI_v1c04990 [Williamsoniiplasma lucivorax]